MDRANDAVWMAEAAEESTHVWSHKARIALFLSAMRHFQDSLRKREVTVHYRELDDRGNRGDLAGELAAAVGKLRPQKLILVEPGEWREFYAQRSFVMRADAPVSIEQILVSQGFVGNWRPGHGGDPSVEGRIVSVAMDHIAIARSAPEVGDVVVHFPRVGYRVTPLE